MPAEIKLFVCSFCEKPLRFPAEQLGRRGKCPACQTHVILVENQNRNADDALSSTWYYQRMRLLRGREDVGPISDVKFLEMIQKGHIAAGDEVRSPELTKGQWIDVAQLNLSAASDRVAQRNAEQSRRRREAQRQLRADRNNREKLKNGIRSIIETGRISSSNRQAIEKFASKAGIPETEVQQAIASQSRQLIREVFEEALDDGILEPREEQQLSQLAISLGVELEFAKDDELRINLCRLAYELDSETFTPAPQTNAPFKMTAKEKVLADCSVVWHEVVTLKRPAGIPLGGDNYLKEIGTGHAYLTTKQVSMVGELQSKKFTLSSVQRVTRFADGVLFNRSSGKSVFLTIPMDQVAEARFALVAEFACSGEPVLGTVPMKKFVPEVIETTFINHQQDHLAVEATYQNHTSTSEPKYTFRVVGDFVGNREAHIRKLRVGDSILLQREPSNANDPNAVAVYDTSRNQLGYLKREVAFWFSHVLGRKPQATAIVHCFTSSGALIVGVYL